MLHDETSAIIACSALKRKYRNILLENCSNTLNDSYPVKIVYLKGSEELIQQRLDKRTGHFMPPTLLKSQLSTLEEPNLGEINCVTVNTDNKSIAEITEEIINFVTVM